MCVFNLSKKGRQKLISTRLLCVRLARRNSFAQNNEFQLQFMKILQIDYFVWYVGTHSGFEAFTSRHYCCCVLCLENYEAFSTPSHPYPRSLLLCYGYDFNLSLFSHFSRKKGGRESEEKRKKNRRRWQDDGGGQVRERLENFMREMRKNLMQRFHSHCYRVIDFQGHWLN